jgi:hypothetical protein
MRNSLMTLATLASLLGCADGENGPSFESSADSAALTHFAAYGSDRLGFELNYLSTHYSTLAGLPFPAPGIPASGAERARFQLRKILGHLVEEGATIPPSLLDLPPLEASSSVCYPTVTGADSNGIPIDTDHDGIPDDWKVDFGSHCVWDDGADTLRVTQAGSFRVQDTGLGLYSFKTTVEHQLLQREDLVTGTVTTGRFNGFESATYAADGAHRVFTFNVSHRTVTGGVTVDSVQDFARVSDFVPDSGKALTADAGLTAGRLTYRAGESTQGLFEEKNFNFNLDTPTPLHVDPACGYAFDGGILTGILNRDATIGFTYTWTSCAAPALEIFGDEGVPEVSAGLR